MTIVERICMHAKDHPNKLAVVFENEQITYGELWGKIEQFAGLIAEMGIKVGDRVIVQASYTNWFVIACYGCHLAGAVFVPIEKNADKSTVEDIVARVDARLILSNYDFDLHPYLTYENIGEKMRDFSSRYKYSFPTPDMIADMMFTTGTTGAPKGVVLSHKNILKTALVRVHEVEIKENNVGITLVPLNHVAPMRELYLNGYVGGTFIFLDGITKMKRMFSFMEQYNVTSLYLPPANISILQQLSRDRLRSFADQIDYVYTASAPMQESQRAFMKQMLPYSRLYFSYGSSENGSVCLHRYDRDEKDITCVGKPCIDVDVKVVNDDFTLVKDENPGTIMIKSDMNMIGYWQRDDLNAAVFNDGYFLSNDIGFYDNEGFLYVTGRKDDVINIGGLKVIPSEIENAVLTISGIDDCVCFAIPDHITGQTPKLLIVKSSLFQGDLNTIFEALTAKLDRYKIPTSMEFVDSIQRTSNGKVDRKFYKNQR